MKISTKGRYALRLLVDIAEFSNGDYVSLNNVADRQNISKKYLEQIVILLNKHDILKSIRGKSGGYMLNRAPHEISVMDILKVTEAEIKPTPCSDCGYTCDNRDVCKVSDIWIELDNIVNNYLGHITIEDILENNLKDKITF